MTWIQALITLAAALLSSAITATTMLAVARRNRRDQQRDRNKDHRTEVERESRERHSQRFMRDYGQAMDVLDDLFRVATKLRIAPATQAQLDAWDVPKIISDLDLLGDKLEDYPEAKEQVCGMWDRLRLIYENTMHFDFHDGDDRALYERGVVLQHFVHPATLQASEASEITHHLSDCRSVIRMLWGPIDDVAALR